MDATNVDALSHSEWPYGGSTPKPVDAQESFESSTNVKETETLRSKADSLWHNNRAVQARNITSMPSSHPTHSHSAVASPMHGDSDTPWHSFFSNYLPLARGFLDTHSVSSGATSPREGSPASHSEDGRNTPSNNPNISSWSSTGAHNTRSAREVSASAPQPTDQLGQKPTSLRVDTQLTTPVAEDVPLASANTISSYGGSAALSRSSTRGHSSDSSRLTSPSGKTDYRSDASSHESSIDPSVYTRPLSVRRRESGNHSRTDSTALQRPKPLKRGSSPGWFDLASASANSQFGFGIRSKLSTVLPALISKVPVMGTNSTIFVAEFGCLNSRSMQLLRPIIEEFAKQFPPELPARSEPMQDTTSEAVNVGGIAAVDGTAASLPERDFMVIHEDVPQADFRLFNHLLDTHPESYMNPVWQASHKPSLQNCIFSSFVSRPFGSRIVPQDTLHFGFSLMDLHWTHTPNAMDLSLATTAQAELTSFLMARAREFCKGGVLVMAFIARSEAEVPNSGSTLPAQIQQMALNTPNTVSTGADTMGPQSSTPPLPSSNDIKSSSPPRDIWAAMTEMLVPCLQRLVSCGMVKSAVARQLLTLPMHPRTPSQTMRVLNDLDHLWELDWSCGAGQDTPLVSSDRHTTLYSEPAPLRLPQPAWVALQSGKISHAVYAERIIQMFKNLYESHFRMVLRERGKLSKGAVEFILDSLWDVLHSRIDDPSTLPLAECELEVQLIALRRR